ncbi:hypothetical protein [Burkholderia gladioli]|uniref:hypothetical protein n=1 Tax=Burkholderia gladioli TaxID=28095 RepID=UPI00163F06FD|nr:hypothetical protein [Burkholderia gladioli]
MKHGVKIIECLDESDPGSEGRFLKHSFNLMQIESLYRHVNSIDGLLSEIAKSTFKYIHISAHGEVADEEDRFRGWWTPNGTGTKAKVAGLVGNVKATAIISTACKSGTKGFGRYVVDELGCQFFIAPAGSPLFYNASLFSHLFYHKLFKTKRGVVSAFNSYAENYKNPHRFRIYERGKP